MAVSLSTASSHTCPLCGERGDPIRIDFSRAHYSFALLRCPVCKVLSHPVPPAVQESIRWYEGEYYRDQGASRFTGPAEWVSRWFRKKRAAMVSRQSRGRVLDIGCGRGLMLRELKKSGRDVMGTHVLPQAAENIETRYGIEVRCGDLMDLALPSAHFGCVTLWHVLEHLPHPGQALEEISRILCPGGTLIIEVPNASGLGAMWGNALWFAWDLPYHLHHLCPESLGRALRSRGFHIKKIAHYSLEFSVFTVLQTLLNFLSSERDLLYKWMRRQVPLAKAWTAIVLGALLAPIAILISIVGALQGRGEIVRVIATKVSESKPLRL